LLFHTFKSQEKLLDKRINFNNFRTIFVENLLKKLPSNTSKLGIVVNACGGSLAQAHIINTKLNLLSKSKGI